MRVLWLAGWYPHTRNPLGGNFVRRHFRAVVDSRFIDKSVSAEGHSDTFGSELETRIPSQGELDTIELYHFATYYFGDKKPDVLDSTKLRTGENLNLKKAEIGNRTIDYKGIESEHIIPVMQFKGPVRFLNLVLYYIKVFSVLNGLMRMKWDIVHVHAADKVGFAISVFKPFHRFQLWLTEHWAIFGQDVPDAYEKRGWWFRFSYRYMWNRIDMSVAISSNLHSSMCAILNRDVPSISLQNVLDRDFVAEIEKPISRQYSSSGLRFLHVSNGEKRKNVSDLVKAFEVFRKSHPNTELILIGSDSHAQYAGVQGVKALGGLPPKKLAEYYQNANALVLVSDAENAPCVILEALCFGLPVIVTQVGGVSEMCSEENSIQIPPFQTHEEKAEKIYDALLAFTVKNPTFDSVLIQRQALEKFHPHPVGLGLRMAYSNQICVE